MMISLHDNVHYFAIISYFSRYVNENARKRRRYAIKMQAMEGILPFHRL